MNLSCSEVDEGVDVAEEIHPKEGGLIGAAEYVELRRSRHANERDGYVLDSAERRRVVHVRHLVCLPIRRQHLQS